MTLTHKLSAMDITLPSLSGPYGAYVPARRLGNLVYVAGQLPTVGGKLLATGPVPSRCPLDHAKAAARQCAINALAAAATVAPIDQITGVLRVGAFVASDHTFTQQPQVANGASELLLEIFGEAGKHVRAAVGVNVLPLDASVEIEFIFITTEHP
jgi:enamine deaminase RidA (YjgF/YER057c/UK114 family)